MILSQINNKISFPNATKTKRESDMLPLVALSRLTRN